MKQTIFLMFVTMILFVGGCASSVEQGNPVSAAQGNENTQEQSTDQQRNGSQEDVQRRESAREGDTTQEAIDEAVESLSATGKYQSPGGENTITVELETDGNGMVQSMSIQPGEVDSTSEQYISRFEEGVKQYVIGKKLSEVEIPERVNGSSLTHEGFQQALDKLREA